MLELNRLNVSDGYLQFIVSDTFKFYNSQCSDYLNEIFCTADDNGVLQRKLELLGILGINSQIIVRLLQAYIVLDKTCLCKKSSDTEAYIYSYV